MKEHKKKGKTRRISEFGTSFGENVTFIMFTIMVLLVFINVIGRFFFKAGITESEELAKILFVWITFIGIVLCFQEDKHIAVDILLLVLSPKAKGVCLIISNLLVSVILLLTGYYGIDFVNSSRGMVSPLTRIPQPLIHAILPVGMAIMVIMNVGKLMRLLKNK